MNIITYIAEETDMSTQKDIIHYSLFYYIAQSSTYLARLNDIPRPSVRRILAELVKAGRARFTKRDIWGAAGYLVVRRRGL
jgi:hypothetical protein